MRHRRHDHLAASIELPVAPMMRHPRPFHNNLDQSTRPGPPTAATVATRYSVFAIVRCDKDGAVADHQSRRPSGELPAQCGHALSRGRCHYPDALPAEAVSDHQREGNGHIDRARSVPVEDLYPDGQQFGQEVYGVGAAFIFASRAFHRIDGAPFVPFCDNPVRVVERTGDQVLTIPLDGGETCTANLRLVRPKQRHHRRQRHDPRARDLQRSRRSSRAGERPADPHPGIEMARNRTGLNDLNDKRIVLTGATTSIGRATLALLVAQGARVRPTSSGRDRPRPTWPICGSNR